MVKINIKANQEEILSLLQKVNRRGINELIEWLKKTDYFTAPASSTYHLSCKGGLAQHSLNVYKVLQGMVGIFNLEVNSETVILCSLLHDLCKVNYYTDNGTFYDDFPAGHGEKSALIAQKLIELNDEEILAIRWHYGQFDLGESTKHSFKLAIAMYPFVLAFHLADWGASHIIEK
jgi:hypothetical protein